MTHLSQVKPDMKVIGADGAPVGTVDAVEGDRIKLTRADSGSHEGHHHYLSGGLVAGVEDDVVRLSATGANAAFLEEEKGGEALADHSIFNWRTVGLGAAAAAGAAALVGGLLYTRRDSARDGSSGRKPSTRTRQKTEA
jgi:hypothetical protein